MFVIAATFLLISGIAALTYQVTWVRLLGLSMGSTAAAISTVLAAFFLGLALGSYLAERITRNRINNLKPYILLEFVIGLSGLLLLPTLLNLDALMAVLPAWGSSLTMKFFLTVTLLIIPTLCMGATFPVMAGIMIRRQGDMGLRMSQLYSLNTAGAVLGAALAGFVFIPHVGLDGAIYIAVALNALIVVLAWSFNRDLQLPPVETASRIYLDSGSRPAQHSPPLRGRALTVLFVTGLVAIASEVGWTKYLVIFAGTTVYGFSAILTVFLIGIAAGSWAIRRLLENMRAPQTWMTLGLVLLGLSLLLTRAGLATVPSVDQAVDHLPAPDWVVHLLKYAYVFVLLFPPTFLFGALFPINLKLYCGDLQGVRSRIGKAYAVNTVAGILGSLAAGFWLIPQYGTNSLLTLAGAAVLALPLIFLPAIADVRMRAVLAALTAVVIASHWLLPELDYEALIANAGYDLRSKNGEEPEFLYLKEGKTGVISMTSYGDDLVRLQNNGLNESVIDRNDTHNMLVAEMLLGLVPYFYHEQPRSAFVVGFGGGITTRTLSFTDLKSIRVVELEPAVVEAGWAIASDNMAALKDPRVRLDFNDARNTLLVDDASYDIIVSQPSHPWRAGASNVFTQQFFTIAASRLNDGGIFGQWINMFRMDVTTLKALIRAFLNVFPEAVSYGNLETGDLLLFGSRQKLVFDRARVQQRMTQPDIARMLEIRNVRQADDLFWFFSLSRAQLEAATKGGVANSDTNMLSEVRLSGMISKPHGDEDPYQFLLDNFSLDILPYLGGDAGSDRLYGIGMHFLDARGVTGARKAAQLLLNDAPVQSRSLQYLVLRRQFRYPEATSLYGEHESWLDSVHVAQLQVYVEQKEWALARQAWARIADPYWRRGANAYLLFEEGKWQELAALRPQNDLERQWQLAGLTRRDPTGAGAQLARLVTADTDAPHLLRAAMRYYAAIGDAEHLDRLALQLATVLDQPIKEMTQAAQFMLEKGDVTAARFVIERIRRLQPEAAVLTQLDKQLEKTAKAAVNTQVSEAQARAASTN